MLIKDYNRWINYFLIGYAFCVPISKAGVNFFEFFIFIFWILEGNWKEKFLLLKNNLLSISILLLIFISLISLPYASSFEFGLKYIGKYRHFLIILVMFTSLQKEYIKHIFSAFLIGMLISEIVSYGIFFEWWHYNNKSPMDPAPFMDHTDYSVYLEFACIILLSRILENKDSIKLKLFYIFFFLTATTNLFINGGRTGQVIFIISIIVIFLLHIKNKLKAIIISTLLLSSILLLAYKFSPVFKHRFDYTVSEMQNMIYKNDYNGNFAARILLWRIGIEKFKEHYLTGTGIGNDMKDLEKYSKELNFDPKFLNYNFGDNHNAIITTSIMYGVLGTFIILLIFFSLFSLKFDNTNTKALSISFALSIFLWSLMGNILHGMQPMIFFTLFSGLFNKLSFFNNKGKGTSKFNR